MSFRATLNEYIGLLGCTASELSAASGLSMSTISRYRSGEHVPSIESPQFTGLVCGIVALSAEKGIVPLDETTVHARLEHSITGMEVLHSDLLRNLSELLEATDTRNSILAKALNFDPSYISRILSGKRQPSNLQSIVAQAGMYLSKRCTEPDKLAALASVMGCDAADLENAQARSEAVLSWLGSNTKEPANPIGGFLRKLEDFDLGAYTGTPEPDVSILLAHADTSVDSQTYYGIDSMMQAELDFLAMTLASDSAEDMIHYSDMPLEDMASNTTFLKLWILGVTSSLKRGLNLHMIHDVNRPLAEMMIGLENWIPLYMTGKVHPYYLPTTQGNVFSHLLKTSGSVALVGAAISGYQAEGKYYLTSDPAEVAHYQLRARRLLKKASPLMRIYADGDNQAEIDELSRGCDITPPEFHNIKVRLHEEHLVIVSKLNDPPLHFVIEHPKMVNAFQNFIAPAKA